MYPNILSIEQSKLLPLLKQFRREFYLVGGTAIALQIGHRESIDYDLFKKTPFNARKVLGKLHDNKCSYTITRNVREQLNLVLSGVKFTFFEYPYPIETPIDFEGVIRMPDLLTLAAMKAYALGRRSKWKDYVDLYFLLQNYLCLDEIIQKAESIYQDEFSAKLFRSQLAYHDDIDYTEEVDYMPGYAVDSKEIKTFLIEKSLNWED